MDTDKIKSALDQYAWEKRQLIVFSPNKDHDLYQLFKKVQTKYSDEFKDRNLHTWHVIAENKVTLNSIARNDINSQDFRDVYSVNKDDFQLLLIGYDLGVKLRQKKVDIKYLFSEIDQMPMRLQEMLDNDSN